MLGLSLIGWLKLWTVNIKFETILPSFAGMVVWMLSTKIPHFFWLNKNMTARRNSCLWFANIQKISYESTYQLYQTSQNYVLEITAQKFSMSSWSGKKNPMVLMDNLWIWLSDWTFNKNPLKMCFDISFEHILYAREVLQGGHWQFLFVIGWT